MGAFSRLREFGAWLSGTVISPSEMEAFDAMRPKLANFADGSTHAPAAPVVVGGEGIRVTKAPSHNDDVVNKAAFDAGVATRVPICSAAFGATLNQEIAASGGKMVLSQSLAGAGVSLEDTTDVQLFNGRWLITLFTELERPATTEPILMELSLYRGGSQVAEFSGMRFSTSASDSAPVSGATVVEITDAANQRMSLRNLLGGSGTTLKVASLRTRFCFVFLGEV